METFFQDVSPVGCLSSYRTYEEWKLCKSDGQPDGNLVLTVPMRNGNLLDLKVHSLRNWVLTVPMRNGNIACTKTSLTLAASVLTVPMRNGNTLSSFLSHLSNSRSYRTYEEWKLFLSLAFRSASSLGSYRTYEEWKRRNKKEIRELGVLVLTVPMRNGNIKREPVLLSTYRFLPYLWGMETMIHDKFDIPIYLVLTVPMRNGNRGTIKLLPMPVGVLTVPMRNGNHHQRT